MWLVFKKHWVLWATVALFLAIIAAQWTIALRANGGNLVYGLDDAYIHMAIAKNFVQHGVWGVTSDGFTSASSSPIWILLLSLVYFIFGVNDIAPLILNILCALAIVILVYRAFRDAPSWYRLLVLLALIFCTPFPFLIFTGMEHLLHTLVVLALVLYLLPYLESSAPPASVGVFAGVSLLAACAILTRYESVFVLLPLFVLLGWRGRWKLALVMAAAAALPIGVYGLISLANGWYFVPNSLLVKSAGTFYVEGDPFNYWLFSVFVNLARYPHLLVMFGAALLLLATTKAQRGMLGVFVVALLLHTRFAGIGTNYRYEAYIMALGIITIARSLFEHLVTLAGKVRRITPTLLLSEKEWGVRFLLVALILYAVLPLLRRAVETLQNVVPATQNIYQQQYQMGMFLRQYYPDATVVLNDIGAGSYFGDIHLIDALGLANAEIGRARQTGEYSPELIGEVSADADIAIVYNSWFPNGLPDGWRAVGSWQVVANNVVLGDMTVTFYAINPDADNTLIAALLDYSEHLPPNVVESGDYVALRELHETLAPLPSDVAFWTDNTDLQAVFVNGEASSTPSVFVVDEAYDNPAPNLDDFALYTMLNADLRDGVLHLAVYQRQPSELAELALFGADISLRAWRLRGFNDEDDTQVLPCERVILESWWQTARPVTLDYSITLSLFGDAAGIIFTDRAPPLATTSWQPGNLYPDARALDIPCDMPRGDYPLTLGIHSADGLFLPVSAAVNAESFFVLTTLTVQ